MKWNNVNKELPPPNVFVETKIDDENGVRNIQPLRLGDGLRLWFTKDGMYVYYTPTHWKPLTK